MRGLLRSGVFALAAWSGLASACVDRAPAPHAPSSPTAASPQAPSAQAPAPKKLELTHDKTVVGAEVRASAAGLPAGKSVELVWHTVNGGWVVEDYYHFRGKKYAETRTSLGRFDVDASGTLDARFKIPEDFGGVHDVIAMIDGAPVAQNGIEVTQSFEISSSSGPIGTPIELKVKGLGWRTMESTWVVNWDNNAVGWISAAGSRGTAVARLRATGPAGNHIIKVYTGWQGQAYLNYEQSPVAHLPRPQFTFRTLPGHVEGLASYAEPYPSQPLPKTEVHDANVKLVELTPTQGPVGTRAMLRAEGVTGNRSLRLVWQTAIGSRVSGTGFTPKETDLGILKGTADGNVAVPISIPDDLGGLHALELRDGASVVARVHFVIETSIVSMTPSSGPAGTPISIHLKGVGWTEYDNIYVATYDNAYMGYACGFNSQGDVVINFTATGGPGMHLIDLYPGIYQGPSTEPQQLYRLPQLTYLDDHPGNKIPALRFAFEVTGSSPSITP